MNGRTPLQKTWSLSCPPFIGTILIPVVSLKATDELKNLIFLDYMIKKYKQLKHPKQKFGPIAVSENLLK